MPIIDGSSFVVADFRCSPVKLIISTGTRSNESFVESHRWTIEVSEDAAISAVLEQVKRECVPSIPALNHDWVTPHLYLTRAESFEQLELNRTIKEYALSDGWVEI
ncbi:MAG: hypothetical protein ACFFAX_02435 [Promethearchaeota archaeon]